MSKPKVLETSQLELSTRTILITSKIEFYPDAARYPHIAVWITPDGVLEISGSSAIVVEPRAANLIHVKIRKE